MSGRAKRFPANFPIVVRKGADMYPSKICNISMGGACIVGHGGLSQGDTLMLDYAVGQARAKVMWSMGRMAGLKFDGTISNTSVNCIRALAVPKEPVSGAA